MSSAQARPMASFGIKLMRVARGEGEFVRLRGNEPRAAVGAFQIPRGLQYREIPADGRNGRADVLGQVFKRRKFNLLEIGFHPVFALFCRHCGNDIGRYWKILQDIC